MAADKRIPVTAETKKKLRSLKDPGTTYDELLQVIVQQHRQQDLKQRFQTLEATDSDELVPLEDV